MSARLSEVDGDAIRARRHLAWSVVVYALILVLIELFARTSYRAAMPRLSVLAPARAHALVEAHCADDLVFRVAYLSLPLLTLALLVRLHATEPLAELGLRGWRVWRDMIGGMALGMLAFHVVWLGMAQLAGTPTAWAGYLSWLAEETEYWRDPRGLALLSLGLCYAMGRLIVPFGHIYRSATVALGETRAAWAMALVFALSHLASTYVSLLALLNLTLAGLAMVRLRQRGGSLGWPLGLLAGWTAVERLADLALSDTSLEQALARSLPPYLSGGFSGVAGSLVLTALLCGWLAPLLWPKRATPTAETVEMAPTERETELPSAEVETPARPEGLEPPTP